MVQLQLSLPRFVMAVSVLGRAWSWLGFVECLNSEGWKRALRWSSLGLAQRRLRLGLEWRLCHVVALGSLLLQRWWKGTCPTFRVPPATHRSGDNDNTYSLLQCVCITPQEHPNSVLWCLAGQRCFHVEARCHWCLRLRTQCDPGDISCTSLATSSPLSVVSTDVIMPILKSF